VWRPGEAVLLRHVLHGSVRSVIPVTVVEDSGDLVTWIAPGTPMVWPEARDAEGRLAPPESWGHRRRAWSGAGVLSLTPAGRRHALWHFSAKDGSFRGWYVNLQSETTRSAAAFDTTDWQLDLWITADGAVEWKDEGDLARAVELGIHTPEEAEAAYDEARRVLDEWPFPTGWEDWRPGPAWPVPRLPEDWSDSGLP
jgi:hypothetical protein